MKLRLLLPFAAFVGGIALADVPTPTVDQLQISGQEAAELAKTLPGDYQASTGSGANPLFVVQTKSLLTTKKLTKIDCTRVLMKDRLGNPHLKSETCTIQKSGNGVPLK